jgi:N-acetyl-anhydromuramyl-L-alanine amidase AmpD
MNWLHDIIAKLFGTPVRLPPPQAPTFHDRRKTAAQKHGKWKVGRRPLDRVTGICLHQTACVLGERVERWDTVGAHFGVLRSGAIVWLHDFDRVVAHGNGWNAGTVGIEVDGLFAGVECDSSTVWNDPSTKVRERGMRPTPEQLDSLEWLIAWCVQTRPTIRALVAHRQSSKDRRNDPGQAIWQATRLVAAELGLGDGGQGFEIGGRPIPEEWDSRYRGSRY